MSSNINPALPVAGTPTTQSVRDNFAAAKNEIDALQLLAGRLLSNFSIVTSRAANAETIAIKTAAGADPSAADPVRIAFRNADPTLGDYSILQVTAPANLTISAGSTLGATNSTAFRLWLVSFNDAGVFRLAIIKCALSDGIFGLQDDAIESSTAEGGAGAADSAGVFYTDAPVADRAMRVLGYLEYTLTTAGTWNAAPSLISIYSHGDRLPGETVQVRHSQTGAFAASFTTIPHDDTIPQNTEGVEFMAQTITPKSRINILEVHHIGQYNNSVQATVIVALFQDNNADAFAAAGAMDGANYQRNINIRHSRVAGTTSPTTFKVRAGGSSGTVHFNASAGTRIYGGVSASSLKITEIMV